tara:strand:+ start:60287 stop:60769 length:483 start_codon:yes stop_codon:yes gene_type:complete
MLKQNNAYGCGLYAVANALDLPELVTPERLEASKDGNTIGQLSRWLQDSGHDYYIEVLYYDDTVDRLPDNHTKYRPYFEDGSEAILPILLRVQFSEEGKGHLIAGNIYPDGKLLIYDSLEDEIEETTLEKINDRYPLVFGLYVFRDLIIDSYIFCIIKDK